MSLVDIAIVLVSLVAVVVVAYIVARIDLWWIHRRAERSSEQQRIVELLKRR